MAQLLAVAKSAPLYSATLSYQALAALAAAAESSRRRARRACMRRAWRACATSRPKPMPMSKC
eukprot:2539931-Pyramimonas_sp.AAC.1